MIRRILALALALVVCTPAWADYRYNPYTGKLDYYEAGMDEAPSDGSQYARKNASWEAVTIPAGTTKRTVTFTFDGNYASPSAATTASAVMGYDGSFTGWKIINEAGTNASMVLTIKKNGSAISGTEKPTLATQSTNTDTALTT